MVKTVRLNQAQINTTWHKCMQYSGNSKTVQSEVEHKAVMKSSKGQMNEHQHSDAMNNMQAVREQHLRV